MHVALIVSSLLLAAGGEATAALQARDAELRAALPPAGTALTPEVQAQLEAIVARTLDVEAIVSSAMGARWAKLTPAQRQKLVDGFGKKLRRAASGGLEDYRSAAVRYSPEVEGARGVVLVPTETRARGEKSEVTYAMRRDKDGWRIVDITVDGVSTVENYRASFARVIAKEGVEGLLRRLDRPEGPAGGKVQ